MDILESTCNELKEIPQDENEQRLDPKSKKFELEKLEPNQCCAVKIPFHALTSGTHTIQAIFTSDQVKLKPIIVNTEVDATIEVELNIGVVMLAYTLIRLSLNFTLQLPDST